MKFLISPPIKYLYLVVYIFFVKKHNLNKNHKGGGGELKRKIYLAKTILPPP